MKKNYFLGLIFSTFIFSTLNAQVVYTDITDITISENAETIDIDFNGDATAEFTIEAAITTNPFDGSVLTADIFSEFDADAGFVMIGAPGAFNQDDIQGLTLGTSISSTSNFAFNGVNGFFDHFDGGAFPTGDTYVGATFKLGTNVHYGWIQVNWTDAPTLTVKDYAYESTPNTAIEAGDMGTTTAVLVNSITVQGQGGTSVITAQGGTLQMEKTVLPATASDDVTWSVTNGTGTATISPIGLLTAEADGTVTVTATANDGSSVTGSTIITISNQNVGISEIERQSISFFPNPSFDFIHLDSKIEFQSAKVYSTEGKLILQKTLKNSDNIFDIRALDTGVYNLIIQSPEGLIYTSQLIKN
jgi:hypothetical protein